MSKFNIIPKSAIPIKVKNNISYITDRFPSAVCCAWTAGIIDGEGNVSINQNSYVRYDRSVSFSVKVSVENTDFRMLKKLYDLWGGVIQIRKRRNAVAKDIYTWNVHSMLACRILSNIKQYLVIKREQADLCTQLQDRIIIRRIGTDLRKDTIEYNIRKDLFDKCRILNKRGRVGMEAKECLLKELVG